MAYLTEGHPTRITFLALGTAITLKMKENTVTPPGIEGGEPNDTTSMLNEDWVTKQPPVLKELSDASFEAQYDPQIYDQILSIINVNGQIEVDFSDGSQLQFWGWLRNFTPNPCVRNSPPTAVCTVVGGNQDDNNNEVAPVYTAAA